MDITETHGCRDFFPGNLSKAKVRAFLSTLYPDVKDIGTAAQKGCWDFEHSAFDEIKGFLEEFYG